MHDETRFSALADIVLRARSLSIDERHAFLESACGDDDELREAALRLSLIPTADADRLERFRPFGPSLERPDLEPGTIFDKYRIVEKIADGGMSTVYRAKHVRSYHDVAVKFLNPLGLSFSAHEHELLGELSHDNIARLFDSDTTDDGIPYLIMEYVDGEPLSAYCEARPLTLEDRLKLFIAICGGIQHAHAAPIAHRDLKPGNILVTDEGVPKIVDFGVARSLSADQEATLTHTAHQPLTLAFASPEQILGRRAGIPSDIYSLGVVLCVLLTGRLPYHVRALGELYVAIPTQEPARPSELIGLPEREAPSGTLHYPYLGPPPPPGDERRLRRRLTGDLDEIVLKAIRKESDKRYQTVAEFAGDIAQYLDNRPVSARRGRTRYRAAKFVRRHWKEVVGASAILLLLVIAAVVFVAQHAETVRQRDRALAETQRAETVSQFLVNMFAIPRPWTRTGHQTTVKEVLDQAVLEINASPPKSPSIRGTLLHALGTIHLNLGMYTPAEPLLTPALKDLEVTRSADRTLIAGTLLNIARLHYYHGRYSQAERYAREVLATYPDDIEGNRIRRDTRSLLGHVAFAHGDYAGAERIFRDVLARCESTGDDAALVGALNDVGCSLHEQGRVRAAEELYRRSVATGRALFGDDYVDVMRARHNLARAYEDEGRLAEAEALYRDLYNHIKVLNLYDPTISLLYCSFGNFLLNRERLVEAENILSNCFGGYRNVLPDTHPDIARSMAALGRAAHVRRRPVEAENLYRESIRRLRRSLGSRHPDLVPMVHNLAVLLAQQGKLSQAQAVWSELITDKKAAAPIQANMRARLLALGTVGLSEPNWSTVPANPQPRSAKAAQPIRVIFSDNFNDGHTDLSKWDYGGNTVVERQGQLRILTTITDAGGWAQTVPIPFDRRRPLTISRRAQVHTANKYFDGSMFVSFVGYPASRFAVSYANYYYTGAGEAVTVGFSLFRRHSNSHVYKDRLLNASPLLPPLWDRWFDEKLVYDPQTGEVQYFLNGMLRLEYNVDPAPPQATRIVVGFHTWGWYTGHYQYMDYITVAQ